MQLKNNNPVSMEKRTDLASLFCMIGRHGPAVAVAVIAMVSVVAGFIIYRTVRGKRRKAAAGAGDGRSPGAQTDASLLEPELEPEPGLEESRCGSQSTVLSEDNQSDIKEAHVTRSPYNLRNRRSAAEKNAPSDRPPRRELEKGRDTVLEPSSVAGMCAEDDASAVKDVSQQSLPADVEDAEENHESSLKPVVTSSGHEHEEVSRSQVDVTTKNVLNEASSQEEENCVFNSPVCPENISESHNHEDGQQGNQTTQTVSMEFSVEEPIMNMEAAPLYSKASEIKEVHHPVNTESSEFDNNNPLSPVEEMENVQDQYGDDQLMAEQEIVSSAFEQTKAPSSEQDHCEDVMSEVLPGVSKSFRDADHSPTSEVTENMDDSGMKNLESSKQEVKSEQGEGPTCNKENDNEMLFCEEHYGSSLVLKTALPCLNLTVDPELVHDTVPSATKTDSFDLPLGCLQPENEDEIAPELAEDTNLNVGSSQSKTKTGTDVLIPEDGMEYVVSSYKDPVAAVCEMVNLPAMSARLGYSDVSSFQNQETDQIQMTEDFSEVTAVPVSDMAESIKPEMGQIQLPSCDQSELTWSSSGFGEESGISSMTVSPDLPEIDIEGDHVVLSVTDPYPDSEDHPEAKNQFPADEAPSVCNEDSAETRPDPCPSQISQQAQTGQIQSKDELSKPKEETSGHEIKEGSDQEMGPFTVQVAASGACLTELRKEMEIKSEESTEDDKTTEISIMEATMDNNEWITDGNYQVLPWMNTSASLLPHNTQTDLVSSNHDHGSVPVDAPRRDTGTPSSTEVEQTDMVTDENKSIKKKVVAVQPMTQNVNVTFCIHYLTHSPYQKVAVTGNQQELGNWRDYILLEKAKDGLWSAVVSLPAESHVEWKFVVVDQGKVCRWEECGNRLLDTGYAEDLLVHKWWGLM